MPPKCPNAKCPSDKLDATWTFSHIGQSLHLIYCRHCGHTIGVVPAPK